VKFSQLFFFHLYFDLLYGKISMRVLVLLSLLIVFLSPVYSQKTIGTLSLQLSFPQDEFKQAYDATGIGLRFNVMHRPNVDVPISIGGELGYLVNGSDSRFFDIYYLGFYDRYRISATNNILTLAFKARADLLPHDKPMQFFVDGTVGTNLFFSSVDVTRETFFGDSEYAGGNSTKGYWAFVWGPGAGIEIPLSKDKRTALSLKASYLFGSRTKYFTDPYIDNNGEVFFTQRESETTVLLMEAGVRFGMFNRRR
jgi:hypothetical protein